MSFENKVVIVTGSSSGIGAATVKLFSKEKAKVVLVGRNAEKLKAVLEDLRTPTGDDPLVIQADISNNYKARSIVEKTIKHYGKLDILVNNAGIAIPSSILDKDYMQKFDKNLRTDLRGVAIITHAAIPHLIKTKGNIVNVSSIASTQPLKGMSAYGTAKAGLDQFSACLALELAESGVRVNVVNPGPVKTNMGMSPDVPKKLMAELYQNTLSKTPLQRMSESEEIGHAILFLASDKAISITGSLFTVDCGVSLIHLNSLSVS